jgi:hypothetical protein
MTMWIECDDPEFRAAHPDLSDAEWAAYQALLDGYDALVRAGERPGNEAYAAIPFGYAECVAAIQRSARHLRAIVAVRDAGGVSR